MATPVMISSFNGLVGYTRGRPGNAGVGMADEGLCATGLEGGNPSGLGGGLPLIYGGTGRFLGGGVTKIGA